jgi:hypothetical protein
VQLLHDVVVDDRGCGAEGHEGTDCLILVRVLQGQRDFAICTCK